jgi:hypothetical protein
MNKRQFATRKITISLCSQPLNFKVSKKIKKFKKVVEQKFVLISIQKTGRPNYCQTQTSITGQKPQNLWISKTIEP